MPQLQRSPLLRSTPAAPAPSASAKAPTLPLQSPFLPPQPTPNRATARVGLQRPLSERVRARVPADLRNLKCGGRRGPLQLKRGLHTVSPPSAASLPPPPTPLSSPSCAPIVAAPSSSLSL
eukprot:199162-Rhodomonas_salina.1